MRTLAALPLLVVILGFTCGCAVGPNYKRPAVNVPPVYRGLAPEETHKSDARSLADEKWWEVFQDEQLKELIRVHGVADKVELTGMLLPEQLWPITQSATLGLGLADREGIHQFLALPNKFFDYIHAGLPQLAMGYPEYEKINGEFKVAVLIDSLEPETIARTIRSMMQDEALLQELHMNCLRAREVYCWQEEEKILMTYYKNIFQLA